MKKLVAWGLFVGCFCAVHAANGGEKLPYRDASLPVEARVDDLMSRMTLDEKIAQLCQYVGLEHMRQAEKNLTREELEKNHAAGFYPDLHSSQVAEMTRQGKIGSFLHVVTAEEANYLQSLALQSRLGIPLLIGIDAVHGNGLSSGSTIYPSPIGQASTFDPGLVERASRQTALEMRAAGMQWAFAPNVDVARDARWGRVGETFGEDPCLVGRMGEATVRGFQQEDCAGEDRVLACIKHLVGGSQPENGRNCAPTDISERTLREVFLPPFRQCVEAGAATLMPAHNEVNGVPSHCNEYLISEVLRGEWGFRGFVVSDWMDIERLHDFHNVARDMKESTLLTFRAGMDMHMHGPGYAEALHELVREGTISESEIDRSVRRILEAKFRLGLFEKPLVDIERGRQVIYRPEHVATALEMARRSIVLLKNDGALLPLDPRHYGRIFVTGPNADNQTILGDWVLPQPDEKVVTIVEGLREVAPEADLDFMPMGWNLRTMQKSEVDRAVERAAKADLAIVVVGDNSMRWQWMEKTSGENTDKYDLSLVGLQEELVERIHAVGIPTIVVLVNGSPLSVEWIADHVPAVIEAWEPGSMGGRACAEILFGKTNPSGKLPVTFPRHSGQIPCYYNRKIAHTWLNYAVGRSTPLFDFGYGLSYTSFEISPIQLSDSEMRPGERITARVTVKNTGSREGEEVVQLYLRDLKSSVVRPIKELKDFRRIRLAAGASDTVEFEIDPDMLKFYDLKMNYLAEPGDFEVMVGNSSRDVDLRRAMFTYVND